MKTFYAWISGVLTVLGIAELIFARKPINIAEGIATLIGAVIVFVIVLVKEIRGQE